MAIILWRMGFGKLAAMPRFTHALFDEEGLEGSPGRMSMPTVKPKRAKTRAPDVITYSSRVAFLLRYLLFMPTCDSILSPTEEQEAVVSFLYPKGSLVQVDAYAGTGKTTTLEMLARRHSQRKMLYLCFNKANAVEAQRRMPSNVKASTIHSLAYAHVGRKYRAKLGDMRARELMVALNLPDAASAQMVTQALGLYFRRPDVEMGPDCVPADCPKSEADRVLRWLETYWRRACDEYDTTIKMPHDGYLKLWLSTKPLLKEYDLLMVDEAQDLEPLTLGFALDQKDEGAAGVILVGDTHQSIYSWRGATNAMDRCGDKCDRKYVISECFRFGQQHADAAAAVLNRLKGVRINLKGMGSGEWSDRPTSAFLARTNSSLIREAMSAKGSLNFAATDERNSFSPFAPYRFQDMIDVVSIYQGNRHSVRSPYLKKFSGYDELKSFAQGDGGQFQDVELNSLIQLTEEFSGHLPGILKDIESRSVSPDRASLSLSTGHRAKGLEWDQVRLGDDFIPVHDSNALTRLQFKLDRTQFTEEANLLYVAMTRARCYLDVSEALRTWLRHEGVELPTPSMPERVALAPARSDGHVSHGGSLSKLRTKPSSKRQQSVARSQAEFSF